IGYMGALFTILDTKGWFLEGRETFQKASQTLQDRVKDVSGESNSTRLLAAQLKARWAFFEHLVGNFSQAQRLYEESLAEFKPISAPKLAGFVLAGLGLVAESKGHYRTGELYYEKSLLIY